MSAPHPPPAFPPSTPASAQSPVAHSAAQQPLMQVRDLKTYFHTEAGIAKAVDGVSFEIFPGEVVGLVGESGSGKSVTALSILRLIPNPPGDIVGGSIVFKGRDLLKLSWDEIRDVRGKEISMIFQEPMTSLNPVFTIGMQVMEAILGHEHVSKQEAFRARCADAGTGRHSRSGFANARLSAAVFRRHAAARDDCHGAGLQSIAANRG